MGVAVSGAWIFYSGPSMVVMSKLLVKRLVCAVLRSGLARDENVQSSPRSAYYSPKVPAVVLRDLWSGAYIYVPGARDF